MHGEKGRETILNDNSGVKGGFSGSDEVPGSDVIPVGLIHDLVLR